MGVAFFKEISVFADLNEEEIRKIMDIARLVCTRLRKADEETIKGRGRNNFPNYASHLQAIFA